MKRIFVIVLALALALLCAGCGNKEPSGVLTVCVDSNVMSEMFLGPILAEFEHAHPAIQVEVEYLPLYKHDDSAVLEERSAAVTRARTELMSGRGADIYIFRGLHGFSDSSDSYMVFPDLERNIQSGVLHDLDFLFQDDRFHPEEYIACLDEAGVWEGKPYVLPLTYQVTGLVGVDEAMKAQGFVPETENVNTFVQQLLDLGDGCPYLKQYSDIMLANNVTIPPVDIENADILLDEPQWQNAMALMRQIREARAEEAEDVTAFLDYEAQLKNGALLFPGASIGAPGSYLRQLELAGYTARFVTAPNENGGVTVMPALTAVVSANCQTDAARELLLYLLSETIQGCGELEYVGTQANLSTLGTYWPVRKGCGKLSLERLTMAIIPPGPISDTLSADIAAMEERIDTVRLPSRYDAGFYTLVDGYLSGSQTWEACYAGIEEAWSYLDE